LYIFIVNNSYTFLSHFETAEHAIVNFSFQAGDTTQNSVVLMRFEVLTVERMTFWLVELCKLVGRYQYFRETYFSPEDGNSMFLQNVGICL
jgi:hypothetical protein